MEYCILYITMQSDSRATLAAALTWWALMVALLSSKAMLLDSSAMLLKNSRVTSSACTGKQQGRVEKNNINQCIYSINVFIFVSCTQWHKVPNPPVYKTPFHKCNTACLHYNHIYYILALFHSSNASMILLWIIEPLELWNRANYSPALNRVLRLLS